MNVTNGHLESSELSRFDENRWRFPPDELLQYAGQYVAWSLDGTHILASADTEKALEQKLVATGVDPGQVVGEFFPNAESVLL
jgi:hypothetical protein